MMMTIYGYIKIGTEPTKVRFAHYDAYGQLINVIEHKDGIFTQPVEIMDDEYIAVLLPVPHPHLMSGPQGVGR